nr:ferredoxin [Treponema sp.]
MGDCLPECPRGAISFEEREAAEYDRDAVEANIKKQREDQARKIMNLNGLHFEAAGSCPGTQMRMIQRQENTVKNPAPSAITESNSQLTNWPVQIKLAPVEAPYFNQAKLLIAADCTAYAYAGFHEKFIKGKVALIGCPKLDSIDYSEKLTQILANNDIKSLTLVRMEVPCCGGLAMAVQKAIQNSGKFIPWQIITISIEGEILED